MKQAQVPSGRFESCTQHRHPYGPTANRFYSTKGLETRSQGRRTIFFLPPLIYIASGCLYSLTICFSVIVLVSYISLTFCYRSLPCLSFYCLLTGCCSNRVHRSIVLCFSADCSSKQSLSVRQQSTQQSLSGPPGGTWPERYSNLELDVYLTAGETVTIRLLLLVSFISQEILQSHGKSPKVNCQTRNIVMVSRLFHKKAGSSEPNEIHRSRSSNLFTHEFSFSPNDKVKQQCMTNYKCCA